MQSATRIEPAPAPGSSTRRSIPTYLVRELIDGIPFYYKGYLPDRESDLFQEYVLRKIRRLFSTGVEKVIWVFTKSRNICIATPDGNLRFYDWDQTVELMDGASMNIAQHIEEEGFNLL
jgi:hypothetical protein